MNKFDTTFFKKYVPEGHELKEVIHIHPFEIFLGLILKISLFVFIPVFLYLYALSIQEILPFKYLEIYLILAYIKIIYDIFNWYNDVWIVTDKAIITLVWSFLKNKSETINYENIEGIGVEQTGFWDKVLGKGDLIINKVGDDDVVLKGASNPFKYLDLIESFKKEKEGATEDDKFGMIMDALEGVVGDYINENKKAEKKGKSNVEKALEEKGTIDLR